MEPKTHVNDFRHRCTECGKAIDWLKSTNRKDVPHKCWQGKTVCNPCYYDLRKAHVKYKNKTYNKWLRAHKLS